MRTFAQKPKAIQQAKTAKSTKSSRPLSGQSRDVHSILQLQRTIGNQAVQRLLQWNAEELQVVGSATTASTRFGHDFSQISIFSPSPVQVQPKLTVSAPGDMSEQEANRVADQVMRMPDPQLQRACDCGGECPKYAEEERLQRKPHTPTIKPMIQRQDEGQEDELLQDKTTSAFTPTVTPRVSANINAMRGGGQSLLPSVRAFFEPRFGADFGNVREHRDSRAAETARAVHAKAFTVGCNVVFGSGQFAPETSAGKRLLAHELAHVVQQRNGVFIQRQTHSSSASASVDPLTEIENELKRKFTDKNDPGLAKRRKRLNGLFEVLNPSVAQSLLDRLMNRDKGDGIAERFQYNLSRVTRKELLLILVDDLNYEGTDTLYNFLRMTKAPPIEPEKQLYKRIRELVPDPKHRKELVDRLQDKPLIIAIRLPPAKDFCRPFTKQELAAGLDIEIDLAMERFIADDIRDHFGNEAADLWFDYLSRRPGDSLAPKIFDIPSSRIVQAFVKHSATRKRQKELIEAIERTLPGRCPTLPAGVWTDVEVKDLLPNSELNHDISFKGVTTIPGLIAGGVSGSAAGMDSRTVSGKVQFLKTTNNGTTTSVMIRTHFRFLVRDAIDFCPGAMGGLLARFVTIPLSRLEASGLAYDVPFEVRYNGPPVEIKLSPTILRTCF